MLIVINTYAYRLGKESEVFFRPIAMATREDSVQRPEQVAAAIASYLSVDYENHPENFIGIDVYRIIQRYVDEFPDIFNTEL